MLKPNKPDIFLLLIAAILVLLNSCRQPLSKDEAETHLRAFDNEIITLSKGLEHSRTFTILKEILAVENVPVPFYAHKSTLQASTSSATGIQRFDFDQHKGQYVLDTITKLFIRSGTSDSIIIHYDWKVDKIMPVRLIITNYTEEASSSSLMFPTSFAAAMYVGEFLAVSIEHEARLEHQLPVEAHLRLKLENYLLLMDMNTRLRKDHGKLKMAVKVSKDSKELASWKVKSNINMTEQGTFFFRSINSQFAMFPVQIDADIDNDAIDGNTVDYIGEFNKHSRMVASRIRDGRKLGEIKLRTREASDKLDYVFYYSDGSYMYIEDLLFSAKHLLNIKK
ncbi:MAG: hypothetical protein IH597_14645 [Bacteroidales bacterium]|nr:hypothetical protein [Bacteroidales bacterium]